MADAEDVATLKGDINEDVDRISGLPNDILFHIVSLLSLKDVVKLSTLSKIWRDEYAPAIGNLNFDDATVFSINPLTSYDTEDTNRLLHLFSITHDEYKLRVSNFVRVVDCFMSTFKGQKIKAFRVCYNLGNEHSELLSKWITMALDKKVEKLDLNFHKIFAERVHPDIERYSLDYELLDCGKDASLEQLRLAYCTLRLPSDRFRGFSSLKGLHLNDVCLQEIDVENIVSNSLVLESLTLFACPKLANLTISNPSGRLKYFRVFYVTGPPTLVISAKNLLTLDINAMMDDIHLTLLEVHQIVHVSFQFMDCKPFGPLKMVISKFLGHISHLETLVLNTPSGVDSTVSLFPRDLPTFSSLKELIVVNYCFLMRGADLVWVLLLLKASPFLQKLHYQLGVDHKDQDDGANKNMPHDCHHHHLNEVVLYQCNWSKIEVEIAMYILANATKLEKMTIRSGFSKYIVDGRWILDDDLDLLELPIRECRERYLPELHKNVPLGVKLVIEPQP